MIENLNPADSFEAGPQIPQRHKDLLDERQKLVEEGKAEFIDWETAKQEIRKLIGE